MFFFIVLNIIHYLSSFHLRSHERGVTDYVTKADIQAQHVIVSGLLQQYPNLRIIAEESDHLPIEKGNLKKWNN